MPGDRQMRKPMSARVRFCGVAVAIGLLTASFRAQETAATIQLSFTNTRNAPATLALSGFSRDGVPLGRDDIRVRSLGTGVTELSDSTPGLATWEFRIPENESPVYGFGERFNSLNQFHEVVVNSSLDPYGAR